MTGQVYDWKRFWYPRGANIALTPKGYPYYTDSVLAPTLGSAVRPFELIADTPCLVLLGEPGIGKSYAMRTERDAIDAQVAKSGGTTLWLDLHSYGSEDRLVRALFEDQTFVAWLGGDQRLHLFLDSLDECLLRVSTVAELLGDELARYPAERLYLRIACRTADWPSGLEANLKQLWGQDSVGVYELAPLRREDIVEAARVSNLSPEVFLAEIDRMDVSPLAIKPVTLEFLINTYKRNGRFPSTQTELYQQGCRLLCDETNEDRRGAKLTGALTADERMAVATRIAAVTVFANKAAVWFGVERGDVPEDDVVIRALADGKEPVDSGELHVTEAAIREALTTGLFSSRGPKRMGWAHQTYAEFLAARYLVERDLALPQMMSLLIAPGDLEHRVAPQLHQAASWLAGMVPGVFHTTMRTDPLVLLRSDVATVDETDRIALVGELLDSYDAESLLDRYLEVHRYYSRLSHPTLAEQLRPYIVDASRGVLVRRVAVDIAEACQLRVLQDELVQVALDPNQPHPVRVNSAYAIYRIGEDMAKGRLKPVAMGQAGCDPDDELKGCGLLATWPGHITTEELCSVLTLPKQDSFFGSYSSFLSSHFVQSLQASDLPVVLRWVECQPPRHGLPFSFSAVLDAIVLRAWESLDVPNVLDALARVILCWLRRFDAIVPADVRHSPFADGLINDTRKRHLLVGAVVTILSEPNQEPLLLVFSRPRLVTGSDLLWMFDRFQKAKLGQIRTAWRQLIERVFYECQPDQFNEVLKAVNKVPVLSAAFGEFVKPVDLNSPYAQRMREQTRQWQEREEQLGNPPALQPLPSERISDLLNRCESGDPTTWWQVNLAMNYHEDGRLYPNELDPDLPTLPGWEAANDGTRARIIETAKQYLLEGDPETPKWLGTRKVCRPAFAGYRALLLLLEYDAEFVLELPAEVWQKWAPIVLAYPHVLGAREDNRRQVLIKLAYRHAPNQMIETLLALIDGQDLEGSSISIVGEIGICWDDRLADVLLEKAESGTLKPQSIGELLDDLLRHRSEGARQFAESLVPPSPRSSEREGEQAVVAARALLRHSIDASWSVVWPAIQQDAEFGRNVVLPIGSGMERHEAAIAQKLSEDRLADLYIWLSQQYPHVEDPHHNKAHWVGPRESIADWRDSLLRHLAGRGTPAACQAIWRIGQELPELDWLRRVLIQAQEVTRRKTWNPPQPEDILRLASDHEVRLVNSGDQLVEVLIEALRRLEAELHGETPAARDIWDKVAETYRPIDENGFSDYVKRWLERDVNQRGIIVNREVEIRRGAGTAAGERTDIHVDAVVPGSPGGIYDVIKVIVEAKGCWHPDLQTAMETQLVDRYLRDNQCRHGIYLVGWFNCDQWDDKDPRKNKAPKKTIEEMQAQFSAQAAELSQKEVRIRASVMNTALR